VELVDETYGGLGPAGGVLDDYGDPQGRDKDLRIADVSGPGEELRLGGRQPVPLAAVCADHRSVGHRRHRHLEPDRGHPIRHADQLVPLSDVEQEPAGLRGRPVNVAGQASPCAEIDALLVGG
jgi:hypothetical protein